LIHVHHLTKRYGDRTAVDDVSFDVPRGQVVGFLGPNGAGKSTTLRVLAGFLGATEGEVVVDGHDLAAESVEARRSIGYMPETVPLYPEMRVVEYLRFRAELKGVARASRKAFVDDAMEKAGVVDVASTRIGHLSKGYRQRVGLADALVARPPLVILDEPTAGLDPNQIRDVRTLVRSLGKEHTVLVSTHILTEVEACATRVLLMHRGKLVADGAVDTVRALRGGTSVDFTLRGEGDPAAAALRGVPGVTTAAVLRTSGDVARVRVAVDVAPGPGGAPGVTERCVAALVAAGVGVQQVEPAGGSLEEVFAALTTDGPGGAS
jgi:ABC-2 type transport system ATP-binding protein